MTEHLTEGWIRSAKAFEITLEDEDGISTELKLEEFFVNSEDFLILRFVDKNNKVRIIREYMLHSESYHPGSKKNSKAEFEYNNKPNGNIVIRHK